MKSLNDFSTTGTVHRQTTSYVDLLDFIRTSASPSDLTIEGIAQTSDDKDDVDTKERQTRMLTTVLLRRYGLRIQESYLDIAGGRYDLVVKIAPR